MINEAYVSYDIAKLLKEKGFDVPCDSYYEWFESNVTLYKGHVPEFSNSNKNHNQFDDRISRPSQSLALKWLREVHKLHIFAKPYWPQGDMRNKMSWQGCIVDLNTINGDSQCYADSYEEAIENRIRFALENLI